MESPEHIYRPNQLRIKRHAKSDRISHEFNNTSIDPLNTQVCLSFNFD